MKVNFTVDLDDYECYERGNYHAGCGACPYFKHPLPAEPEKGAVK